MYTVLIVDDEAAVCRGLEVLIPWGEHGFEVVGCALSGNEAIKILEKQKIDLLITDIKMPGMSGLELIRAIRKKCSDTRIVIISAYNDFEYAKHAIRYGVKDYISKPIDELSIINILKDVKSELEAESSINNQLDERRKLMFNQLLLDTFNEENHTGQLPDEIAKLGISLEGGFIYVSLVHIADMNAFTCSDSVIKRLEEIVLNYCSGYVFKSKSKNICIVAAYNKASLTCRNKLELEIYTELNRQSPGKLVVATGDRAQDVTQIKTSYNNAVTALNWALLHEKSGLVDFKNLNQNLSINRQLIDDKIKDFKHAAVSGMKDSAEELIREILSNMIAMNYPVNFIYSIAERILLYLDDLKGIRMEEVNIKSGYSGDKLYQLSAGELQKLLISRCQVIDDICFSNINNSGNQLIHKVIEYTVNNSSKDLSLKTISELFHINYAYLGRLFLKTTGTRFSDFLNDCRIKNAANLLITTDNKVYEIAYSVGYTDIDYFTRVFKEKMNMSPLKYRGVANV